MNRSTTPNQQAWNRFKQNRIAVGCLGFLLLLSCALVLEPWISNHKANVISDHQFQSPDWQHWFGTDVHGRDLFARVLAGTRVSLLVGFVGAMVSLVIGVFWGAIAGYVGGKWDSFLMRTVDVLYTLPSILFVIVLITTLEDLFKSWMVRWLSPEWGSSVRWLFLFVGLGAVSWLTMARIVRGQVLSLKSRGYVEESRALGASHARIICRHIIPNISGIIIVYIALTIPSIILSESFLSYLGLGVQPPQASLGSLIADGAGQLNPIRIYWWLILFPGGILASTLLALNFLSDGLRDALDPKS